MAVTLMTGRKGLRKAVKRTATKPAPWPVVLVVGLPDSVHTARWLRMVQGGGIQFIVLPVYFARTAMEFDKTHLVRTASDLAGLTDKDVAVFDLHSVTSGEIAELQAEINFEPWRPSFAKHGVFAHPAHLAAAIERFRPVLIHSMVVQFGGYLCAATKDYLKDAFPKWLLSNWGSDIFLFRALKDHRPKLLSIAASIDAYHAECDRDIGIMRQLGFRRTVLPTMPASGGMDFSTAPSLDDFPPPSQRREILIKGYHGWSGRGEHILAALHLAADAVREFSIRLILASPAVQQMAAALREADGLQIIDEPYLESHREALVRLGSARMVIGLGISDGISTTLLEAMAVGTFPIQGEGSCGNEWITCGETGSLVSPHDVRGLAAAIRRAATDDHLVDSAALRNRRTVEARWNAAINGPAALKQYHALIQQIVSDGGHE